MATVLLARPTQTQVTVRASATDKVEPAFVTRPLLRAPELSLKGFIFERHQLTIADLVAGRLVDPVVVFPLAHGVNVKWRRNGLWVSVPTLEGAFISFPAGAQIEGEWQGALDALVLSFKCVNCRVHFPELGILPTTNLRPETNVVDKQLWHLALAEKVEIEAGCPSGTLYTDSLAVAMSLSLLVRHGTHLRVRPPAGCRIWLHEALRYVRQHIDEELSLETLAGVAHITPDSFRHIFKKHIGVAPHQYILHQRIERAKQLLSQSGLSIAEVAFSVGFSSQAHLTTAFRRHEGTTPKQFRRQFLPHQEHSSQASKDLSRK